MRKAQEFASAYGDSLPFVDNGQASIQDSQPMLPILEAFKALRNRSASHVLY